jgi:filamentous hemagglutinin family protein
MGSPNRALNSQFPANHGNNDRKLYSSCDGILSYFSGSSMRYVLVGCLLGCFFGVSAQAQVAPDGTLPTVVKYSDNLNSTVTGGALKGSNLFHSFSTFSIPTVGSVSFDLRNTPNISTIFSRVTGGEVSNINGTLRTLNGKNPVSFFLLNPNGIVFGPRARLDISGSLIATTADRIKFTDDGFFDATDLRPTLLSVSVPIGLAFGDRPGAIAVNQSTLRVSSNQSLLLAGNDLNITGKLYAEGGRMDLASISGRGLVDLILDDRQALGLRLAPAIPLGHLSLGAPLGTDLLTRIYVEAPQGGSLNVTAQNADLLGDTAIYGGVKGKTAPQSLSGDINFDVSDRLFLDYAAITNRVNTGSQGHAGNVNIRTGSLKMLGGSFLSATTRGVGNAGKVQVSARAGIVLDGQDDTGEPTGIFSSARSAAIGNGGKVSLTATTIDFTNGAIIELVTQGRGDAGQVSLTASDRVSFVGTVKIPDAKGNWYSSSILNNVDTAGVGNGGDIEIIAPTIAFSQGATLLVNTRGQGNAGNIRLQAARSVLLDGMSDRGVATSFQSDVETTGIGNGGNIAIQTPRFQASRGAFVSVSGLGKGDAGNLRLIADRTILLEGASLQAKVSDGNQGNVAIQSRFLSLQQNSQVITTATGLAQGGNISIDSDLILGLGNSDITANAIEGQGGNVQISAQGLFGLRYGDRLTPGNDITASSQFGVNGTVQVNSIGADLNSGLVALPVDTVDPSQTIATGCEAQQNSSFIATGRGGMPMNPDYALADRPWSDLREQPGNLGLAQSPVGQPLATALVEATVWQRNAQGQPELIAARSPEILQATCGKL